jgi:YfiH family protein
MIYSPFLKEAPDIEHGFGDRADGAWLEDGEHAWPKQIHSAKVLRARAAGLQGEADAVVTTTPELWVSVRTADCLPILLADTAARVVAAVHAGWRGTVAGITRDTVRAMTELGAEPTSLVAAIGPGIGPCCFEVGPEVSPHFGLSGQTCVDLAAANERQLLDAGLLLENIWVSKLCTRCNPDLLHSYRRDGAAAGRMVSAIRLMQA